MNSHKVITANLTDIVFEDRNQNYGAYVIRKTYNRRMIIAFSIVTAVLALLLFGALSQKGGKAIVDPFADGKLILEDVYIPEPPQVEPPEVQPTPPIDEERSEPQTDNAEPQTDIVEPDKPEDTGVATQEYDVPTPDPNASDSATVINNSELEGKNPGTETKEGTGKTMGAKTGDNEGPGNSRGTNLIDEPSETVFFGGKMPEAQNLNDIKRKITYPAILREVGMEGRVILRVLVGSDGEYIRHIVKKSDHPEFTKACEKEVKKLRFTPGEENGKKVKVWVTIPFKFRLSK